MNILVITPKLTGGGAEKTAANLGTLLKHAGHNVHVAVFDMSDKTYDTEAEIIDLQLPIKAKKRNLVFWYLKALKIVRKIKKEKVIDVTISFLNEPDLVNVFTDCGDKRIISIRNYMSLNINNKMQDYKLRCVCGKADGIVALSKGVKNDLVENFGVDESKIKVIYNPCDIDLIRERSEESVKDIYFQMKESDSVIVSAGRLTNQKGQWHLIRAFSKVVQKFPSTKLLILGQGELKDYLKTLIDEYNLSDVVILPGYMSNPYAVMKKADIFCFSSLWEGLGNILLEAMACGLPIISTDCPTGPREILAPCMSKNEKIDSFRECDYGILSPLCDGKKYTSEDSLTREEQELSKAICYLLKDESLRKEYSHKSYMRINAFSNYAIGLEWTDYIDGFKS